MQKKELFFKLEKPARKSGGDRYEHGEKDDKDFITLYLPQSISREEGEPTKKLKVTIEEVKG